ncbi:TonB-dependent receptor domain-containing protein [Hymenobacter mucosus]|uniref:Iron complex outermembrane recepter protein n=1 Tax=Hymenobacter mucosus TaxID=1411120 RepID=A0A239ADC3_9BACT|nr:TonB-dependent receptor [Hymenobacter mucosus]SNR93656.1 iron complex outermembrane recepter protein [Hymenobacter mucosus]
MLLPPLAAWAQTTIRGEVREGEGPQVGTPLVGALISSPQTNHVATTDSTGRFELRGREPITTLTVNHLGHQAQTLRVGPANSVLRIALMADAATTLAEATVTSKYYRQYTTQTISSALRLQTPLLQLSQDIQSVGPEVIFDQGSFNTTESVTRNVSGVIRNEISNNLGPNLYMRGGQIASLRNGVDLTPYYRGPVPDDAAIIEQIEFVKGPSLFMNNIGDPAGSFNIVTKQPTGGSRYSATAMLGSYNFYRLAADLDGKLDKPGRLLYRFNTMALSTKSFVPGDYNRRLLVAPVLKYQISDRTAVTAEYSFQTFTYGLYSPIVMTPRGFGTLPHDFTISERSVGPIRAQNQSGFLTLSHQFNPHWQLTVRGAFLQEKSEGIYLWVTGLNPNNADVLLRNPKYDLDRTRVFSQQAFLNGRFTTGALTHQLLTGVDVNQKQFQAVDYLTYNTVPTAGGTTQPVYYPLNVTNPVYGAEIPGYRSPGGLASRNTSQTINYYSAYVLDEIALLANKLRITPGLRYTAVNSNNHVLGASSSSHDQVVTPRLGVSYSLLPSLSVYGLFDRTLVPQGGITSNGTPIDPLRGLNRELGIKKNWLDGRWTSAVAVYYITRSSIAASDPTNALYRIQVGKNHAQGVDFDLMGQVVRGLNVVVNYAYTDSRIDQDVNPLLVGVRTPLFVKHVQNAWLNYELPARLVRGLSFSLGYQYQAGRGGRYAVATPYPIPDFFRLDGGLGWQSPHLKVNLVVNNLMNHNLITTPWLRNGLYYWIPQAGTNGRLSVSYTL